MAKYKIGRAEDSEIRINDLTVSRTHAEIERISGNRFVLRDLDSTYGTHVYRENEWVEILEIEVKKDTPIRFGDHRTTVAELMALQITDAEETDRPQRGGSGEVVTGGDAPEAASPRRASKGAGPSPAPGPAQAPRRGAAGEKRRGKLLMAVGGGFLLLVIAAAATAAVLLLRGGEPSVRERLMAFCMERQGANEARCACEVDFILSRADRLELDYIMFANENPDEQSLRDYRAENLSEAERRRLDARLIQIRLGVENQCRVQE